MPYANNKGVKIYYEVEGQGPPLVLAHGANGSLERWRRTGFADVLNKDYRLILFDARGHGKSDKPHSPAAYGINMVQDVVAVLDDVRIDRANYLGYSMGAGVGFKTAVTYPERFSSFVLGGWNPYRSQATAGARPNFGLLRTDPQAFLRSQEQRLGRPLTPEEQRRSLDIDLEAEEARSATFIPFVRLSNQELATTSMPCLLYAGESDAEMYAGVKEAASHLPQATFFSLPGLDHGQAGISPLALPHIKKFLARVNKT